MRSELLTTLALLSIGAGCGGRPDPRTLDGATAYAAAALEEGDARRLYNVLDSRSRFAMISIVEDRHRARERILARYPEEERAAALAALGDGAEARDARDLFARRCDAACIAGFREAIGAVVEQRREGAETVVKTTRERELRFYRRRDSDWWGLVWRTQALSDERDRANRDLAAITANASTYDRRRALDAPP